MKLLFFLTVHLMTFIACDGQNLIGYNSNDIRKYMSENMKDMNMDKVNNKSYRYLKYSDKYDTQTILFFLNPDSVCSNIRIVCNNSIRSSKIKELDSTFSKKSDNSWTDKQSGKNYQIRLVDDDWSFTITLEPEK